MNLEINGILCDNTDSIIALTRNAINLDNLTLRQIDFTNRFRLPKTNINKRIFGFPEIMNSNNTGMDILYNAKLVDQIFLFNGKGFLTDINDKYFEFQLSEASRAFFDDLNKPIHDLDFEDDDFIYNASNYTALNAPSDSVFVWPVMSMHQDRLTGQLSRTYIRPHFLFKTILNKIFTSRNWNLTYSESDLLDYIALSSNHKTFYVTSFQKTLNTTYTVTTTSNITGLNSNDFLYNIFAISTELDLEDFSTIFRFRGTIIASSDFTITIKGTTTTGDITQEVINIPQGTNQIDFTSDKFETDEDHHYIQFILTGSGTIQFSDCLLYTLHNETDLGDLSTNPLDNYLVKAYDNLPELNQIDIFRAAMVYTNSIIVPDSFGKSIELKSLKNLSKLNNYDWSEKFNNKSENIENQLNGYAQKNYLAYDNDDTIPEILGRGQFLINNEALQDEITVIDVPFAASKDIIIDSKTMAFYRIYDDSARLEDELNPRIVFLYENSGTYYAKFETLDFIVIKTAYYQNIFDSFERLRVIQGEFNLNKLDVYGFDFTKVVYIEYFKSHFMVISIDDFIPGKLTKVKLLKFL